MNKETLHEALDTVMDDDDRLLPVLKLINELLEFAEGSVEFPDEREMLQKASAKLLLLYSEHGQPDEEALRRMVTYLSLEDSYREQNPQLEQHQEELDALNEQVEELTMKLERVGKEHRLEVQRLKEEKAALSQRLEGEKAALTRQLEELRKAPADTSKPKRAAHENATQFVLKWLFALPDIEFLEFASTFESKFCPELMAEFVKREKNYL